MQHLIKNVRISRLWASSGAAKASSALYGRAVDMRGFEGCLFIFQGSSKLNDGTTGAYMRIQAAAATSATFYSLSGTTASSTMGVAASSGFSSGAFNFDNKTLAIDIFKPFSTHRHLRPIIVGTSTGDIQSITAIQYGPRRTSTSIWKGSTLGGSTRWLSTQLGGQTLAVSPAVTTATTK